MGEHNIIKTDSGYKCLDCSAKIDGKQNLITGFMTLLEEYAIACYDVRTFLKLDQRYKINSTKTSAARDK